MFAKSSARVWYNALTVFNERECNENESVEIVGAGGIVDGGR